MLVSILPLASKPFDDVMVRFKGNKLNWKRPLVLAPNKLSALMPSPFFPLERGITPLSPLFGIVVVSFSSVGE